MLNALKNMEYEMSVDILKPWRYAVTLTEIELIKREKVPTGRSWTEPFDPVKGDPEELEMRFQKQIEVGPPEIVPSQEDSIRDHLSECFCLECLELPPRFFQLIKKWRRRKVARSNA